MVSTTQNYQFQGHYTIPAINAYYDNMMEKTLEKVGDKQLVLAGDGRNDSPGHSAQYCTYILLDTEENNVIAMAVVDKRETGLKSGNMEKLGFERALINLIDKGVNVAEVVTDQHIQIASLMKKKYPDIKHSFDIWHAAKNMSRKINQAGQQKGHEELLVWSKDIVNHFWHCAQEAEGSVERFIGKWRGLVHHVTGKHTWALADVDGITGCTHGELEDDPERKEWMEAGGLAHSALNKIVFETRFINNIPYFVNFRHTGVLESINSHQLMYAAKRYAYSYPAYKARCMLSLIDYQMHKDRDVKKNKNGEIMYKKLYSKRTNTWSVYAEKVPKEYSYIKDILTDIIERRLGDEEPLKRHIPMAQEDPRRIAPTTAKVPPPKTADILVEKRRLSRFKKTSVESESDSSIGN